MVFAFSYAIIGAMRSSLRICVGVVVLLALADGLAAQTGPSIPRGMMDGIVTDTSLAPIAGATISLFGSPISAKTGENGRFRIVALPAGEYVVMARRLGYASASVTLHVEGGDTLRPSFALRRVTPELDTVRASAIFAVTRLGEFEERRARSIGGHFITADEIYRRNPTGIGDMLATVLSVAVVGPFGHQKAIPMRVGTLPGTHCSLPDFRRRATVLGQRRPRRGSCAVGDLWRRGLLGTRDTSAPVQARRRGLRRHSDLDQERRLGVRRLLALCLVTPFIAFAARALPAQERASIPRGAIDGIVTDTNLVPLAGATISLLGSSITTKTGENGRFRIVALPPGEYVVLARRLGYASGSVTLHVERGDTLRPSFSLQPVPTELDTVRASAVYATTRLGEFEERRSRKIGHFVTADEIYKRNPVHIADMLQSVLSVNIVADRIGRRKAFTTRDIPGKPPCPFQIFVDGQIFDESGDLSNAPPPGDVAGIEIYSGPATIPLEYKRHDTMCGIILIWTKIGE